MKDRVIHLPDNETGPSYLALVKELTNESDRAAALLAAAWLDEKMKALLHCFLVEGRQTKELLDSSNSPINTLSARLNMAFAIGIISEDEYQDCHIIRKIRNDFAHQATLSFSFDDPKISKLCKNLKLIRSFNENWSSFPSRNSFISGSCVLFMRFLNREPILKKMRLTRHDWNELTFSSE